MTENLDYSLADVYEHLSVITEALIDQAQTINYLVDYSNHHHLRLQQVIKLVRTLTMSLKYALPSIKEIVETTDGNTGVLSKNIMPRLAELEKSLKKDTSYSYIYSNIKEENDTIKSTLDPSKTEAKKPATNPQHFRNIVQTQQPQQPQQELE